MHELFAHTGAVENCMRTSCDAVWICALPCAETCPRVLRESSMRLYAASCRVHASAMIEESSRRVPGPFQWHAAASPCLTWQFVWRVGSSCPCLVACLVCLSTLLLGVPNHSSGLSVPRLSKRSGVPNHSVQLGDSCWDPCRAAEGRLHLCHGAGFMTEQWHVRLEDCRLSTQGSTGVNLNVRR